MTVDPASDDAVITNFRAAHEHQFKSIRKIAAIDGLIAFLAVSHWIDSIARAFNGSSNRKANWRKFIKRYFPREYHAEPEITRLYNGLRGALSHRLETDGVYLTDDPKAQHWAHAGDDHRFVHLATFLNDCESAWAAFTADIAEDAHLRAAVAGRTVNVVRPVIVLSPTAAVASTATPVTSTATPVVSYTIPVDWPRRS